LNSASSRGLLRGAPNPSTTKFNHLKWREESLGRGSRELAERQKEAIPNRGANHQEGVFLPDGGRCEQKEHGENLFQLNGGSGSSECGAIELNKISRSKG